METLRQASALPFPTGILDVRDTAALTAALLGSDAVVSCVPYHLNLPVAEAAHAAGVHYLDLTEDVHDCEVLRSGRRQMVPAMSELERVVIGGVEL